ncbi:Csu type fimbrial protein [Serratia sp. IR-2025]|uniref:Spore coat U domain-containing protein n=1 Tax=Serratia fonticola TaxID=47917 RepID=A0AAW3WN25_SERFO|nr:spore coat U domain-containing protein [Serratia fonticola]MBC3212129.1 spore coat U domain-containing protein [Serratia fonticola]NYA11017.1 spore coat U domain-containing protein [Serratia fonticola]NYA32995.1 spore coat U domain-containing protein [Serratia fonticola]
MGIRVLLLLPAILSQSLLLNISSGQAATIGIAATLLPACEAGTTTSGNTSFGTMNFGNFAAVNTVINATSAQLAGSIRVKCVSGLSYKILLDGGSSGVVTNRKMVNTTNSSASVLYNLYTNQPGGTIWDNTTGLSDTGNGADQWHTVYGRVPAQTTPAAGIYLDTVNVTVSW